MTTLAAEGDPELVTELAVVATDRDRLPQRGRRAGIITERSQRLAVSGMKVGIARVEAQRLGVRRRLLGKAALATIDRTERAIGRARVRTQTQRFTQGGDGGSVVAPAIEHGAEVIVRVGVSGIQSHRFAQRDDDA